LEEFLGAIWLFFPCFVIFWSKKIGIWQPCTAAAAASSSVANWHRCQISQIWHFEKASGIEKIKWYFGQNLAYFCHFRKKIGILLKIEILNLTLFVNREKCQLWKA
jgi:hypothetical protein